MYRFNITLFLICISFLGKAQINMCIEKVEKEQIQSSADAGVYMYSTKWTNGSKLTVSFIGGSQYVRNKVIYYAKFWEQYANIHFNFEQSRNPDILISFQKGKGSWSQVGNLAKTTTSKGEPSMNFGWFDESTLDLEFKRTTLHEFGHALGLMHEHQNPLGGIQWNTAVVYNYFFNTSKWSKEDVDRQVIQKYSVELSNHTYDRNSIMHYPIPSELTLNHYSVPFNSDLSTGDISLIKELYPGRNIEPINPMTGNPICTLKDIGLVHNVYKDNKIGMLVNLSFTLHNGENNEFSVSAYFYYADGTPLKDYNKKYYTFSGGVATGILITPSSNDQNYQNLELFIPYEEFELGNGKFDLKSSISIWTSNGKELIQSGSYYFTYTSGIISENLHLLTNFNNYTNSIEITPQFDITNAQNLLCTACVYFFYEDGTPISLAGYNNYSICHDFIPPYYSTIFNYQYYLDFTIPVFYSSINISPGTYKLKYFVSLFNNGNQFKTSEWYSTWFTK